MSGARPAAFIDRDGTILEEADYLADPDRVRLIPGAAQALGRLREAGYAVVVVTNQSGIARGLYSLDDYRAVAARLDEVLAGMGVAPDATYFCPHHPEFTGPCDCRKPLTGNYERAARELDLDLSRSWYVGDKATDVLPAQALGGRGILVRTGYGPAQEAFVPEGIAVADDLARAVDHVLSPGGDSVDPKNGLG